MEQEMKKAVTFGWIVLTVFIIVSFSIMLRIKHQTEAMYTDIPCPRCGSMTVYCFGHDDIKEEHEFKCMTCKTRFTISDYD